MLFPPADAEVRTKMRITTELIALAFAMLASVGGTYVATSLQLARIEERQIYTSGTVTDIRATVSGLEARIRDLETSNYKQKQAQ